MPLLCLGLGSPEPLRGTPPNPHVAPLLPLTRESQLVFYSDRILIIRGYVHTQFSVRQSAGSTSWLAQRLLLTCEAAG